MTSAHALHGSAVAWLLPAAVVLVPALAYGAALRLRRAGGRGWPRWRVVSLVVGLAMAATAVSPALQTAGHADLRAHMVQHLLLGMYAPLALVLAAPATLLLGALPVPARRRVACALRSRPLHVLAHPVTAALLDVGGLHLLYLTPLYALARDTPPVHHLVTAHVLLAGYLFAWSIGGPDPAPHRPGTGTRVAVLIVAGAAHGHLAKLLYAGAGGLPPDLGAPAGEVQEAAQLMYYGGTLAELALAIALFGARYRRGIRPACGSACGATPRPSSPAPCATAPSAAAASARVPPPRPSRRPIRRARPPRSPAAR